MNAKVLEREIGFREIQLPNIFGKNVRQISATFDPNASLNPQILSTYPEFSKKRLNEFLAGRICALKAMEGLSTYQEILPIGKDKKPLWPYELVGSIAHTDNKVSSVVLPRSLNLSVGLDLESIFDKNTAKELGKEILLESEKRYLDLSNYSEIISLIYSAKEAVFKAVNSKVLKFLDFKEIELITLDFSLNFFQAKLATSEIPVIEGKFAILESLVLTGAEINI